MPSPILPEASMIPRQTRIEHQARTFVSYGCEVCPNTQNVTAGGLLGMAAMRAAGETTPYAIHQSTDTVVVRLPGTEDPNRHEEVAGSAHEVSNNNDRLPECGTTCPISDQIDTAVANFNLSRAPEGRLFNE